MPRLPRTITAQRSRQQVFIDASAQFAALNRKDQSHQLARDVYVRLAERRYHQLTTNVMIIEAHALITNRIGAALAARYLASMYGGNTEIIRAIEADETRARAILGQYADKAFSYADAISFAVMERLGIQTAFSFDKHFRQYGLVVFDRPEAVY